MENITKENTVSIGTLYDVNKRAVAAEKPITPKEIKKLMPQLEQWFNMQLDGYAMLLCRERYDFTVFHLYEKANPNPPAVAASELIEVLKNRGKILAIDEEKTGIVGGGWEIWMKIEDEIFVYYLFNCDDWVIQC